MKSSTELTLTAGMKVEARLPGARDWTPGKIVWAGHGHYGVDLQDTSFTISVPPYCVRVVGVSL